MDQLRQTKQRIGIPLCLRHRRCTCPHPCQSRLDRPLRRSQRRRCLLWRRRRGWDHYRQQHHPHEVAEDGASAAGWSRAARTALDARDASIIGFTRCACAAREECPVARTGTEHRVTALYTSGTAKKHASRFTRAAQHCVEVTVRDR